MRVEALKAAVIASKGTVGLVRIEKRGELGGMGVGTGILAIYYLFIGRPLTGRWYRYGCLR